MTLLDRSRFDHRVVLGASGVLADFNQAGVLDPVDVHTATTLGRMLDENDEAVQLALALAVRGTRFGHVCIELPVVRETVVVDGVDPEVVDALPWPDPDTWSTAIARSPLVADGDLTRPLVLDGDRLYLQRYWAYERAVAAALLGRTGPGAPEAGLEDLVAELLPAVPAGIVAEQQREAVTRGATQRLTVVAGGPGTGKTYSVSRLLGVLAEAAIRTNRPLPTVAVAAPTGKAAARLTDQVRDAVSEMPLSDAAAAAVLETEASTLHRLLGWHPQRGRFRHDATNPLPHDVVIVDEMSMVSLPLMARLLDAVRPDARLMLVGDPDQLASIEAGTVLGDLVGPTNETGGLADHVVVLDRVYRFGPGSGIAEIAEAVRLGNADRALTLLRSASTDITWFDTEQGAAQDTPQLTEPMVEHARRVIDRGATGDATGALTTMDELAVLCAHRRGPMGVEHWNPTIEQLAGGTAGLRRGEAWYPGRPVMVTVNDYQLGLFNGDLGVAVASGDGIEVAFPDRAGARLVGPARLPQLETVYAMTIHKSQGSQFERVVVLLPDEESRLLTRELLYTAITRARSHVTLAGSEAALRAAIERPIARSSGLAEALSGLHHDPTH